MSAVDTLERIYSTNLVNHSLKCCLVDERKKPYRIDNTLAKPNNPIDFVELDELLLCKDLSLYRGVGISIQASNIFAIDVDHCFEIANDEFSGDERASEILSLFRDKTYCEFSFSGKGLRILFVSDIIDNYSDTYYIKNESNKIEFYQPSRSFRYVTITGNVISNKNISYIDQVYLKQFLDTYMKRKPKKEYTTNTTEVEERSFDELKKVVRRKYLKDVWFQDLWFHVAPGSGSDESERDYQILCYLYENVTQDKQMMKDLFETSYFFKTKDWKHVNKWNNQNGRYYNYVYDSIVRNH